MAKGKKINNFTKYKLYYFLNFFQNGVGDDGYVKLGYDKSELQKYLFSIKIKGKAVFSKSSIVGDLNSGNIYIGKRSINDTGKKYLGHRWKFF